MIIIKIVFYWCIRWCILFWVIKLDEVLEDFNVFFRKKLMLYRVSVDGIIGMGIYFVGQAILRCSDPLSIEMKRIGRNMLLCLRRMEERWTMLCEHEDKLLLLQCFSVLIDFYRFNVFRFKVTRLINSVLLLLRENREALGLLECVYATRLLAKLYSIGCADDSFWELSKNIYDSFINGLGPEEKELATVSSPFILKSDEQYYLMTEDQYCIPLV